MAFDAKDLEAIMEEADVEPEKRKLMRTAYSQRTTTAGKGHGAASDPDKGKVQPV